MAQVVASLWVASHASPGEFAFWGIASIVFNVQYMLAGLGLGTSIMVLRGHVPYPRLVDTSFVLSIVIGIGTVAAALLLSDPIGRVLDSEVPSAEFSDVVRIAAIALLFMTIAAVPQGIIESEFAFARRAAAESLAAGAYLSSVFLLFYAGEGVWSLIIGRVIQAGIFCFMLWMLAPVWPSLLLNLDWTAAKALLRYGSSISLAAILAFAFANLDTISVGAIAGASALGAYTLAFTLANLIPTFLSLTVGKVFFPLIIAAREERTQLERVYSTALHLTGIVVICGAGALVGCGAAVVPVLFGPEWTLSGQILTVLAFYGAFRALAMINGSTLAACGFPQSTVWLHVVGLTCTGFLLLLCINMDALGVALAFTGGQAVGWIASIAMLRRRSGLAETRVIVPATSAACIGALSALSILHFSELDGARTVILGPASYLIIAAVSLLLLDRRARRLWKLFREQVLSAIPDAERARR
jgi:PST family polysaccharide transporter